MQRVRLALCNRKAASLFGELSAPAGFVGAVSRSFLCLFRQPGRGVLTKLVGFVCCLWLQLLA
jgi:hypothetical protein